MTLNADQFLRDTVFNTAIFAQSATYTASDGTETTVTISKTSASDEWLDGDGGEFGVRQCRVVLPKDTSIGIASPDKDATITIDSEKWAIEQIEQDDEYVSVLRLSRVAAGDRHAGQHYLGTGKR